MCAFEQTRALKLKRLFGRPMREDDPAARITAPTLIEMRSVIAYIVLVTLLTKACLALSEDP